MQDMQWLDWWKNEPGKSSLKEIIDRWSLEISQAFSGAEIRWASIHGRRWEYIGGSSPGLTFSSERISINEKLGLCLANAGRQKIEDLTALQASINASLAGAEAEQHK